MLSFENDYLEGAHEKVLNRLVETNRVQAAGYGFKPGLFSPPAYGGGLTCIPP